MARLEDEAVVGQAESQLHVRLVPDQGG